MVTYQQLQAEPWWSREIVTPELDWLGDEICRRTGRARAAAGSKGDNDHLSGAHRSQEWIRNSVFCTNRTYTVQTALTPEQMRHISGFDFVPATWGSSINAALMRAQTGRLIAAYDAGLFAGGVREIYGRGPGETVVGRRNGAPASSDDSHLEHWHVSLDRRRCTDRALMDLIVRVALGDPLPEGEDDMPTVDEIWAKRFAEYVDEDESGTRESATVADILYRTHRNTVEQDARLATLEGQMAELLRRVPDPDLPADPTS